MSFALLEISRTGNVVRYGLFLDAAVDPGSDGIESFEVLLEFAPSEATYTPGSLTYPAEFIGLTNEQEAAAGRLRTGGISLTPFTDFEQPLISFELDVSALVGVGPGDLLLDGIYIDGAPLPEVSLIYTPFPNTAPTGSVTISGEAIVDGQLEASNTLADEDGLGELGYQWYADGSIIEGATASVYHPTLADKGKTLTVTASYTDGQFFPESVSSAATAAVTNPGLLIEGGPGPDSLSGGQRDDTLVGLAGRDTLRGDAGDDLLQGGDDIDTAVFSGALADYTITRDNDTISVNGPAADGNDLLTAIERLAFADRSLAFDLDGHAGQVAKLLGTVIGKDDWYIPEYVGIGLSILDDPQFDFEDLMTAALDVVLGPQRSNADLINMLFVNLIGIEPSAADLDNLVGLLDSGEFTQVGLAMVAAEHPLNQENIGLVGLQTTGLEYLPV